MTRRALEWSERHNFIKFNETPVRDHGAINCACTNISLHIPENQLNSRMYRESSCRRYPV